MLIRYLSFRGFVKSLRGFVFALKSDLDFKSKWYSNYCSLKELICQVLKVVLAAESFNNVVCRSNVINGVTTMVKLAHNLVVSEVKLTSDSD